MCSAVAGVRARTYIQPIRRTRSRLAGCYLRCRSLITFPHREIVYCDDVRVALTALAVFKGRMGLLSSR